MAMTMTFHYQSITIPLLSAFNLKGVRHGLYDHIARLLYGEVEGCETDCGGKKVKDDDEMTIET